MTRNGTHPGETRKWKLMKMLADVDIHSVWSEAFLIQNANEGKKNENHFCWKSFLIKITRRNGEIFIKLHSSSRNS